MTYGHSKVHNYLFVAGKIFPMKVICTFAIRASELFENKNHTYL